MLLCQKLRTNLHHWYVTVLHWRCIELLVFLVHKCKRCLATRLLVFDWPDLLSECVCYAVTRLAFTVQISKKSLKSDNHASPWGVIVCTWLVIIELVVSLANCVALWYPSLTLPRKPSGSWPSAKNYKCQASMISASILRPHLAKFWQWRDDVNILVLKLTWKWWIFISRSQKLEQLLCINGICL